MIFQTTRFPSDEASGFAIAAETLPVIAVNRNDALTRRAFSLLHELAHLMIRVSGVSELDTDVNRPPEDQRIEVFCNSVAAAALIPRDVLMAELELSPKERAPRNGATPTFAAWHTNSASAAKRCCDGF